MCGDVVNVGHDLVRVVGGDKEIPWDRVQPNMAISDRLHFNGHILPLSIVGNLWDNSKF